MPEGHNNREGPQAREPSKCLNGWSYRERPAKEAFSSPATGGSKKDSERAITPAAEAVHVPAHLAPPGSLQAKQPHHLHEQLSLGQSGHRQKSLVFMHAGSLRSCPTLSIPVDCGLPGFRGGFSRQEYWSALANTGFHTLLEHYISCYSSSQPAEYLNPCDPSSHTTSTPGPPRGRPKPSRAASGANPSGRPT